MDWIPASLTSEMHPLRNQPRERISPGLAPLFLTPHDIDMKLVRPEGLEPPTPRSVVSIDEEDTVP